MSTILLVIRGERKSKIKKESQNLWDAKVM